MQLDQEIPLRSLPRGPVDEAVDPTSVQEGQTRQTLSVAIVTLNEEANLARTLSTVQFADEVIVIDSGSTDRTVEIARGFDAKVYVEPWKGFARQKTSAIEKCSSTWILSSMPTKSSPRAPAGDPQTSARQTRSGRLHDSPPQPVSQTLMRFGGYYPDPKLRLFRRHSANFAPPTRFTERPVHETIAFDGALHTLQHDLIHNAYSHH